MDFLASHLKEYFPWRNELRHGFTSAELDKKLKAGQKQLGYSDVDWVLPKLKVGIEVEVENVTNVVMRDANFWAAKEDGSLRNHGLEFVTVCGLAGPEITYAVHQLFKELAKQPVDFSERTSIHCHVNARNMTCGMLLNTLVLYMVFEKLLYRYGGSNRYNNIFCVPIEETKLATALTNYLLHGKIVTLVNEWAKYTGLNILPLKSIGSIEYRQMRGHGDPEILFNWINILQRIHQAAQRYEFKQLFQNIQQLNTVSNYEQFLNDVFKREAGLLMGANLQKEMEFGVSLVKTIRLPSPFLKHLVKNVRDDSSLLKSIGVNKDAMESFGAVPENDAGVAMDVVAAPQFFAQERQARGEQLDPGDFLEVWRGLNRAVAQPEPVPAPARGAADFLRDMEHRQRELQEARQRGLQRARARNRA